MKSNLKLIFLILLLASCRDSEKKEPGSETSGQTDIEKIKLTGLNGSSVNMKRYKGKVVFINFWATWCKPCIQEMPTIKNAIDSLKKENIEFLFASDDEKSEIGNFETKHNYGFNYVRADNAEELSIIGLPTTFIFDKNGKKVFSDLGYRKWDDKSNLDLLLKIAKQP